MGAKIPPVLHVTAANSTPPSDLTIWAGNESTAKADTSAHTSYSDYQQIWPRLQEYELTKPVSFPTLWAPSPVYPDLVEYQSQVACDSTFVSNPLTKQSSSCFGIPSAPEGTTYNTALRTDCASQPAPFTKQPSHNEPAVQFHNFSAVNQPDTLIIAPDARFSDAASSPEHIPGTEPEFLVPTSLINPTPQDVLSFWPAKLGNGISRKFRDQRQRRQQQKVNDSPTGKMVCRLNATS